LSGKLLAGAADLVQLLAQGELAVHPTESLYGIAAHPLRDAALDRLDRLKGRSLHRGYVLVVGSLAGAQGWVQLDAATRLLLERAWPGPLSVVCRGGALLPARLGRADGSVALRVDRHPASVAIGALLGSPWVSTSLNFAGQPPARTLAEVPAELAALLAGAWDTPPLPHGLASTLVQVQAGKVAILREGAVARSLLQEALDTAGLGG